MIDAAGNAEQANAAIQNFVQRRATAIVDMVFPHSSIGAGLDAAKRAKIPVVTWGGGLGGGVAATNGSGGPMVIPVNDFMIKTMDGKGSILALTYHTGEVWRNREVVLDKALADHPGIKVTKNEVRIPGYFEDGAQYANAWLASHPADKENLAIWGMLSSPDGWPRSRKCSFSMSPLAASTSARGPKFIVSSATLRARAWRFWSYPPNPRNCRICATGRLSWRRDGLWASWPARP